MTKDELRAVAVGHTLFRPTTLQKALDELGFVQADPIRAPARAQDLTLRHRVKDYRAGDMERRYPRLRVEEDFFINYGFVVPSLQRALHPRERDGIYSVDHAHPGLSSQVLDFVRKNGPTHPRQIEDSPIVENWWGGQSQATTQALDALHYRGHLKVVRRDKGIRVYGIAAHLQEIEHDPAGIDTYLKWVFRQYAPLPHATLGYCMSRARHAAPHLKSELQARAKALMKTMPYAEVGGRKFYWPEDAVLAPHRDRQVRLLAPFDPVVWDRHRFEALWDWEYRFEAYTPPAKRVLGYYALPLLYGTDVIGWANVTGGENFDVQVGFAKREPKSAHFRRELDHEVERMRQFLHHA